MAKRRFDFDFAFFNYLRQFYIENRGTIRNHYRNLSKKFLDFNNPKESNAFLWEPQFEALEMYVFLKEYLNNRPVHQIFEDWHQRKAGFETRSTLGLEQKDLFGELDKKQYEAVFNYIKKFSVRNYSSYIFALPMGTGKTILMATCIFYEFLLANKFPKDPEYCHNALVFAPDRTVLQSLKEIQTFDIRKVVPPEYINFLSTHIKFHFLEEAGTALSTTDRSRFNIIISNTQKIILKRQHKEKTGTDKLFRSGKPTYEPNSVYGEASDLYDFDTPEDDKELTLNQRFEKLSRLEQLGIFVDEAHHAFGNKLERDMGIRKTKTSLRLTIDKLSANLSKAGTHVVACYNFTGTPYIKNRVIPEVVYGYGFKEAIDKAFLKKVVLHSYTNPRSAEFVKHVITHFWENHQYDRYEGMLPKLALFAAKIDELQNDLRPAVEKVLDKLGISRDKILVNVGDTKLTSNDELREFINLDTPTSEKQFILLVNKGREGWNCRSLFGVALYRRPRSKIFVLQASMRCLRSIGEGQQSGHIYLSGENAEILDNELHKNFRVGIKEIQKVGTNKQNYKVRVVPPPVKITLKRVRRLYQMSKKKPKPGFSLELDQVETDKYRLIHIEQDGLSLTDAAKQRKRHEEDLTHLREKRNFSRLTLVAEISRYLNCPCLEIEEILENTQEGIEGILKSINEFNELLYDIVIPRLFNELYELKTFERTEDDEIELIKTPEDGYYRVSADPKAVVERSDRRVCNYVDKSFHVDTYCFDSEPEQSLFWNLITDGKINKVYFTGMFTHKQSDFHIQYIDPDSHTVRRYYPDFLMQDNDGSFVIVEVKGDNMIDDDVVQAKAEFTEQMAKASKMSYRIIKGSDAIAGHYHALFE